jgi:Zn-dependent M32 family carboxypeptidase
MFAAQIYAAAAKALPDLDAQLAAGDFKQLREWLRKQVHERGSLDASGDELMVAVTGAPLDPSIYLEHLKSKYRKLYKL